MLSVTVTSAATPTGSGLQEFVISSIVPNGQFISIASGPDRNIYLGYADEDYIEYGIASMTTSGTFSFVNTAPYEPNPLPLTFAGNGGVVFGSHAGINDLVVQFSSAGTSGTFVGTHVCAPLVNGSEPSTSTISVAASASGTIWFAESSTTCLNGNNSPLGTVINGTVSAVADLSYNKVDCWGDMTFASDGALWMSCGNGLLRYNTATNLYTRFSLSNAGAIAPGANGSLWYVSGQNTFATISPSGVGTEYIVPNETGSTYNTLLDGIVLGPDGNVYLSDPTGRILQYNPQSNIVTFFDLKFRAIASQVFFGANITVGLDGNIYMSNLNEVAKLTLQAGSQSSVRREHEAVVRRPFN